MNSQPELSRDQLRVLLERSPLLAADPEREEWLRMAAPGDQPISARLSDRAAFLDTYRRRRDAAITERSALTDALDRIVKGLEAETEEQIAFVLIEQDGFGHMLWLDPGLTRVVAHFRAPDRRVRPKE